MTLENSNLEYTKNILADTIIFKLKKYVRIKLYELTLSFVYLSSKISNNKIFEEFSESRTSP